VLGAATSVDAPLSKLGLLSPPAIDMPSSWKYKPLPTVLSLVELLGKTRRCRLGMQISILPAALLRCIKAYQ
jgi:hypothetical protein